MPKKIEIKKILELTMNGVSQNAMEKNYHISKRSSKKVLSRAKVLDVTFETIKDKNEQELSNLFFPERENNKTVYESPDYKYCQRELRKTGVTLKLLWNEYKDDCILKKGLWISYGQFCKGYHSYVGTKNITNHLEHKPAKRIEVDWSGPTMWITDGVTGKRHKVYLFVATLPYSQYSYVEVTQNMSQENWIKCNVNMLTFFGGTTREIVCDNLKTGVIKHPKDGDIVFNEVYKEFGEYYPIAIMPGRVSKPKDKPSVEGTVGKIATAIIAKLRNETFYDMQSLKMAVSEALLLFNTTPFQKKYDGKYTRYDIFRDCEKDLLTPLPNTPFEYYAWVYGRKVGLNAHIQYNKNFYSCSYKYIGQKVDLKVNDSVLRIYHKGHLLATHPVFPKYITFKYSTNKNDMPEYFTKTEWDKPRIMNWAKSIGPNTTLVIEKIFLSFAIKEQGYRSSLVVLHLSKKFTPSKLELACEYALTKVNTPRHKHIKAILESQGFNDMVQHQEEKSKEPKGILRGVEYFKKELQGDN